MEEVAHNEFIWNCLFGIWNINSRGVYVCNAEKPIVYLRHSKRYIWISQSIHFELKIFT